MTCELNDAGGGRTESWYFVQKFGVLHPKFQRSAKIRAGLV